MRPSSLSFFFISPFAETLPALRLCARAARFLFRFAYTSIMSMTSSFGLVVPGRVELPTSTLSV